jgi:sigma-E factor negative regulatory protein RseC
MIEEQARVVAVAGDMAEVATLRHSACAGCAAKSGCGTSLLAAWFPERELTFRLRNPVDARVGDTVVIGLNEDALQRSSLLLYGLPLIGLLGGAIVGDQSFAALTWPSELGAVSGSLFGLGAALWVVRKRSERRTRYGENVVRLLRIGRHAIGVTLPDVRASTADQTTSFRTDE